MAEPIRFEETILYKTHRHPIVMVNSVIKLLLYMGLPIILVTYFLSNFSFWITVLVFLLVAITISLYQYYLWSLSWLLIGNQKVTLFVRNGIFSQYSMNIRHRNIRDCACSKNNVFSYLFKYGTLFCRSSGTDWDFTATFVPKVGKVYALINALSRYSDDDREGIKSIEALHSHHITKEFPIQGETSNVEANIQTLLSLGWITWVVVITEADKKYIFDHEEARNHGVFDVLKAKNLLCFTHDHNFRASIWPLSQTNSRGETFFPSVSFPELMGKNVLSASPSLLVHEYLSKKFEYITPDEATVLVGWS